MFIPVQFELTECAILRRLHQKPGLPGVTPWAYHHFLFPNRRNERLKRQQTEMFVLLPSKLQTNKASSKMAGFFENERLKYYSRELNREGTLNILMVSTSDSYLESLANGVYRTREVQREKRSYNLKIHTCKSILDVLQFVSKEFYIDYIVFILDSHIASCLSEVENNLTWLDPSFTREKICLVVPDFSYPKSKVSPADIWDFAQLHQFNLINGKTKDEKNLFNLTKRILNLSEACCGILNGIPMVNLV